MQCEYVFTIYGDNVIKISCLEKLKKITIW